MTMCWPAAECHFYGPQDYALIARSLRVRVVVANAQTPFVRGGAEMLADSLMAALAEAGHEAELVTMPFKWYPAERIPEAMLAARLMEVGEWAGGSIDRLIALKFPAYLMRHPEKSSGCCTSTAALMISGDRRLAISSTRQTGGLSETRSVSRTTP
jgi:hypothetical protein